MKLVRKGKLSFLRPTQTSTHVTVGFSTRNGGVSRAPYHSLNLGLGTDDPLPNVEGNRSTFIRSFDLSPHQLLTAKQVHGNDILLVDQPNPDLSHFLSVKVDAIVTNQPGIMVGVLTADCLPILLWHPQEKIAAAIHAGWRGTANGLVAKTVQSIRQNFHVPAEELQAAIGPGIGAHNYEVDRQVRNVFRQGSAFWEEVSEETRLGHWNLDLSLSCRLQLEQAGLKPQNIEVSEQCTCCHPELFFSHRRDNGLTGRQIGFIKLN